MNNSKAAILILFLSVLAFSLPAQENRKADLRLPLDLPPVLAGNFGELRPNHFHSGIDFKTQGRTGFAVHSAADGYVKRVSVSPWGFGRAVYVDHPEIGLTTVYGHMEAFTPELEERVRQQQYKNEAFSVDLEFGENEFPVKKGDVLGRSGNAGSSFGPHVHMDVRKMDSGIACDPLDWYGGRFKDTTAPQVRHLGLYPVKGQGVVSGKNKLAPENFSTGFTAWGKVYPAINAFDKMDGTSNIYGIKYMSLSVDGVEVYNRVIDSFDFDRTRAVNTLAYYPEVASAGRWMMQTYVPVTAPLPEIVNAVDNGIIDINEERNYKFEFVLKDHFGNTRKVPFTVRGKKSAVPGHKPDGFRLNPNGTHSYDVDGVTVRIPQGVLYDSIDFNVSHTKSDRYLSDIISIGDAGTPLAGYISIEIPVKKDRLEDKSKYVLARINGKGNPSALDAGWRDGKMIAEVNRFGRYAVLTDTVSPKINPVLPASWSKKGVVKIKISDNLSGIDSFKGEVDGKFAIFELDGKSGVLTYVPDPKRVAKGKKHSLKLTVTDACGNSREYKTNFQW